MSSDTNAIFYLLLNPPAASSAIVLPSWTFIVLFIFSVTVDFSFGLFSHSLRIYHIVPQVTSVFFFHLHEYFTAPYIFSSVVFISVTFRRAVP